MGLKLAWFFVCLHANWGCQSVGPQHGKAFNLREPEKGSGISGKKLDAFDLNGFISTERDRALAFELEWSKAEVLAEAALQKEVAFLIKNES